MKYSFKVVCLIKEGNLAIKFQSTSFTATLSAAVSLNLVITGPIPFVAIWLGRIFVVVVVVVIEQLHLHRERVLPVEMDRRSSSVMVMYK